MSILPKNISKNLILVFILCKELKLNFSQVQSLFLLNDKIFWKFTQVFLPAFKITVNKFTKLNDLATKIFNNWNCLESLKSQGLFKFEEEIINEFSNLIANKYEDGEDIYTLEDFVEYLKFNKGKFINILLNDGSYITAVQPKELFLYETKIIKIILDKKEYNRTSLYDFEHRLKEE